VEAMIRRKIFVGSTVSERRLLDDILKASVGEFAARKAIQIIPNQPWPPGGVL